MNNIQNEIYGKPVVSPVIGEEVTVAPQQSTEQAFEGRVTPDLKVEYPGITGPESSTTAREENPLFKQGAADLGKRVVPPVIDHTTRDWFEQQGQSR